jgi:hypothetical protein
MGTVEMVLSVAHLVVICWVLMELGEPEIRRSCNRGVSRTRSEYVLDRLMEMRVYRTLFWD